MRLNLFTTVFVLVGSTLSHETASTTDTAAAGMAVSSQEINITESLTTINDTEMLETCSTNFAVTVLLTVRAPTTFENLAP